RVFILAPPAFRQTLYTSGRPPTRPVETRIATRPDASGANNTQIRRLPEIPRQRRPNLIRPRPPSQPASRRTLVQPRQSLPLNQARHQLPVSELPSRMRKRGHVND